MDKQHSTVEENHEEKKVEEFAAKASSNKNEPVRTMRMWELITGRYAIVFVLLLVVISGLVIYKSNQKPKIRTITINRQVLIRRSTAPSTISRSLTGKATDATTGKIVAAARLFDNTIDKTVYLELDLFSAPKGTVIDYIQYKQHRYVAHGEVNLQKPNTQYVLFSWNLKNVLPKLTQGSWTVATYANGILAKRVNYTVTIAGSISYISPDKQISPSDPDYTLKNALIAAK